MDVEWIGDGDKGDTRYAAATENGPVIVGTYARARGIRADDGIAGFRTAANGHDGRCAYFSIRGTKHSSEYVDITGTECSIAVEGRWVEVGDQKVGFSMGNTPPGPLNLS